MSTEENFFDFKCPYCGETNSFPLAAAGQVRECFNCLENFIVPGAGGGAALKLPFPLKTPRLILRCLQPEDWKNLMEIFSDEEMVQYLEGGPFDEEAVIRWLTNVGRVKLTTPQESFCLGIELLDEGKLIGHAALTLNDKNPLLVKLDIFINRKFQRQGLATEALGAVMDFCFKDISLHRAFAWCDSRNTAACRVFEKVGMRREGVFLKDHWLDGAWRDSVYYARLGEEHGGAGLDLAGT